MMSADLMTSISRASQGLAMAEVRPQYMAMATMVLACVWVVLMFMLLLLLEPTMARTGQGILQLFFVEVSAYTTTGYSICDVSALGDATKCLLCANMLFGRVGMFTFMLIFIRRRPASPFRLPETRLPLS